MRTLVADDDLIITTILSNALSRNGMQVTVAHDGDVAWQALNSVQPPALAILDWMMPNLDGLELCRRIRSTPRLASMYVILVTARDSREDLVAGLEAGADDYMAKPINIAELQARIGVGTRVAKLQQNLAQHVKELSSTRDHLARMASTDVLTGVYSRRWWFDMAEKEFARARRYNRTFSLLMADLDWFKQINDTYGHEAGDKVLNQFGDMLRKTCRKSDVIGRLGGEEFAVLLPETSAEAAQSLAARITKACLSIIVDPSAGEGKCSCSIGVTEVRQQDDKLDAMLTRADQALYAAKRAGRNQWSFAA
ncbi:MAG TPA: diguanylate cyclase [Vicinamibacterales bacterium]|nr:diguanylate cyclase [Vicinamibacterales bacterium]